MKRSLNPIIDFYNQLAENYDAEQNEERFAFVRVPEWNVVSSVFSDVLNKDMSVLEIGAGTGRFTLEMAPLVKKVLAIDIAGNMLDQMKRKLEEKNINNVQITHDHFLDIDFSETFDLVVSFSAIEYIQDTQVLFKKIADLCSPGGKVLITTAHNTFFRLFARLGNYFRQKVYMNAFSKKEIKSFFETNGLKPEIIKDISLKTWLTKGILLFILAHKEYDQ